MENAIQLYSMNTPNGQKIGIALEEMQLRYEPHVVNIKNKEQFKPEFIKISPYSKIPAIVDPQGPAGKPISIFESGAILIYLGRKSERFWPQDPHQQTVVMSWLFLQVGGVGPMFGQFGHFFKMSKEKIQYGIDRYTEESKRLLTVLDHRLADSAFLAGQDYTIADMATVTWVNALQLFYQADKQLGLADYKNLNTWKEKILQRPAVVKGLQVCKAE